MVTSVLSGRRTKQYDKKVKLDERFGEERWAHDKVSGAGHLLEWMVIVIRFRMTSALRMS